MNKCALHLATVSNTDQSLLYVTAELLMHAWLKRYVESKRGTSMTR
jgi:hypothetical protein